MSDSVKLTVVSNCITIIIKNDLLKKIIVYCYCLFIQLRLKASNLYKIVGSRKLDNCTNSLQNEIDHKVRIVFI